MIAGIFQRKGSDLDLPSLADTLLGTLNQFGQADYSGSWSDDSALLCSTVRFNTPESQHEHGPHVTQSGQVIAFWGRLTNRDQLAQKLGVQGHLKQIPDPGLIEHSLRQWGRQFIDHLQGDFSLVLYDPREHELLCCADPMGVKPLYYFIDEKVAVFSSTPALFHRLDFVPTRPDLAWAARYVLNLSMDFATTAYADIFKLPPGHTLTIGPDSLRKRRYFAFDPDHKLSDVTLDDCLEQYRDLLDHAVRSRIRTDFALGSETSGGLDSSSVTALAARHYDRSLDDLHTFGLANLDGEPGLILETSRQYGLRHNHICCTIPETSDAVLDRSLEALGYPCEHANATFHTPFYEQCRSYDIRTLLSGFGGDEFVTTIHGNIILSELIRTGKYAHAYATLRGNPITASLRLLKHMAKQKWGTSPEYCLRFLKAWQQRWPHQLLRPELEQAYDLKTAYFDKARFDAGYTDLNRFTLEQRMVPFVTTRMNNCTLVAESYGIDYAWPLLDVPLIAYFLAVPTEYKLGKAMGRYFHRKAMEGRVPNAVNWKPSKHMGDASFNPLKSRRPPALCPDLHPDIDLLVDVQALQTAQRHFDPLPGNGKFMLRQNLRAVHQLDAWLKKYHPKGALWNHHS